MYRPAIPFTVAMKVLAPQYTTVQGVPTKTFPEPKDAPEFFGSFRTFGGSETLRNDVFTVVDTGVIDTWYNPAIKSDCQIYRCETGDRYEVLSTPEDISMRHQFMQFKVKKIGGKA